jgi:hypothetical protein
MEILVHDWLTQLVLGLCEVVHHGERSCSLYDN